MRVPLVQRLQWIGDSDLISQQPKMARRFYVDISEEALAQMGARVVEAAVDQLGRTVPHLYAHEIQAAVDKLLFDFDWLKPILENEVRRATRDFVLSLWSDDEKKALRDWFDVFTAKCLESNQ